jgi:glycosyltransferase involved in cell wall biosynthesis
VKIAIDARFLGPEGAGLGKYTEKLLENLQNLDKENEYFIILKKSNFHLFRPRLSKCKKVLADAKWYSLKEQVIIPRIIKDLKPDFVHFLHYNTPLFWNGKFVVTIYDLTKLEFGRQATKINNPFTYLLKQAFHNLSLKKAVTKSELIIAGSESTKEKIIHHFNIKPGKIVPIYAAADDYLKMGLNVINEQVSEAILKKYRIGRPFIIYIGNAYPYKNLSVVLRTLRFIKDLNLVYVSSRDVFSDKLMSQAKELGVEDRLIITGYVPNENLSILYKLAECFVFPSLSEGFGLPGLEAMASDCPLIASDTKVFKEIYGDAALYFDPRKPSDLTKKINRVLNDTSLKTKLVKKGRKQADKYSWEKTTVETLKIYNSI